MNIPKLVNQGRLKPIHKTDDKGVIWLVGFERNSRSHKAGRPIWLKNPVRKKEDLQAVNQPELNAKPAS